MNNTVVYRDESGGVAVAYCIPIEKIHALHDLLLRTHDVEVRFNRDRLVMAEEAIERMREGLDQAPELMMSDFFDFMS